MTELIFQGGDEIQKKDLESHLSSLCQLENVGVLLGAGSSKSANRFQLITKRCDISNLDV